MGGRGGRWEGGKEGGSYDNSLQFSATQGQSVTWQAKKLP